MSTSRETRPAGAVRPITKGSAFERGEARAVWVGTAGTLNFTDPTGYAVTNFPAQVGLLPVKVMSVQTSGTASDLWWLGE
jgi:hypothetical protein